MKCSGHDGNCNCDGSCLGITRFDRFRMWLNHEAGPGMCLMLTLMLIALAIYASL